MGNNFEEAIELLRAGDKLHAGQIFKEIVIKDPQNLSAWFLLANCVSIYEQRIYCLNRVLKIDPNHNLAKAALIKLQQPQQVIHGMENHKADVSQRLSIPSSNQPSSSTSSSFQPRYLTALAGIGIMIGTVFPWAALVKGSSKIEEYSGFTVAAGILTAIAGLAIVFIAIFHVTKPGKSNSLISSLFALAIFIMACLWATAFTDPCWDGFFTGLRPPTTTCYRIGTGFGYGLSMFSLFLAFIFGLIPNPKR